MGRRGLALLAVILAGVALRRTVTIDQDDGRTAARTDTKGGERERPLDATLDPAAAGPDSKPDDLKILFYVSRGWSQRYLRVELAVYTTNPARNYQFEAWSTSPKLPPVRDDLGNSYLVVAGDAAIDIDRWHSYNDEWAKSCGFATTPHMGWLSGSVNTNLREAEGSGNGLTGSGPTGESSREAGPSSDNTTRRCGGQCEGGRECG